MTEISLTRDLFGKLEIPGERLVGVYGPNHSIRPGLGDEDLRERIRNPVGASPLREMARGARNVLVVTDDITRQTPLHRVLPPLIEELAEAGVPREGIRFLIGLGTHRAMTDEEITRKFGEDIPPKYPVTNHIWDDPKELASLGVCDLGFEVLVNRLVTETDFLIAVGSIIPHATAGFSGGGKSIMPGVCGEATIEATHWAALDYGMGEILANFDNRVREAAVSVCRQVGLRFIVNTIMCEEGKVFDLVAGDVEEAHRLGTERCLDVYGVAVEDAADVVVAEAFPTDIDLRQAIKAVCSADIVCRDGGVIILPADCPEGVSPQFPDFSRYGFRDPEGLFRAVEAGEFTQKLLAYTLVAIGRIISKRVKGILVSAHVGEAEAERMGFLWAPSLQEAADRAMEMTGPGSRVMVLKEAGEIIPRIRAVGAGAR
ncbi:MAG: nickel-dependent lactate racemase [bacterium]